MAPASVPAGRALGKPASTDPKKRDGKARPSLRPPPARSAAAGGQGRRPDPIKTRERGRALDRSDQNARAWQSAGSGSVGSERPGLEVRGHLELQLVVVDACQVDALAHTFRHTWGGALTAARMP